MGDMFEFSGGLPNVSVALVCENYNFGQFEGTHLLNHPKPPDSKIKFIGVSCRESVVLTLVSGNLRQ